MLEESEREAAGKTYDEEAHQQLADEIAANVVIVEEQQQQKADLSAVVKQEKQNLEQRTLLTQELNQVLLRAADIATLKIYSKPADL